MTELPPIGTILLPADHIGDRRRSAGRAAPHVVVRIVDAEDREVPTGVAGEITVRSGQVMLGYWNHPELSAETLRGGWMHTGDVGTMDADGFVQVVDRLKDMIISGGENV
jgi:acyl-CoA synthetase (AMP-forming)/AMP-acid ligase II